MNYDSLSHDSSILTSGAGKPTLVISMLRNLIGLRRYCSASLDKVEALVIGGGVVGLAIAKSLSEAGKEVLILENSESFGTQTSSRYQT